MNRLDSPELNTTVRRNRWASLLVVSLMLLAPLLLLPVVPASADPYFNSSEPGCDGSDPNILFCEDFETPGNSGGRWYAENCDDANSHGGIGTSTKGWCGTIYADPITPTGAELCGTGIGVGSNCVGHHGTKTSGEGGVNMADHGFTTRVEEVWIRYYQKWNTGYRFGAEKTLTFNEQAGSGGIKWGNLHINCGGSGTPGQLQWQPIGGGFSSCLSIGMLSPGNWYAIQVHAKLSTTNSSADGFLQVYLNDCGPTGLSCTGTPTLRLNQQNMSWSRSSATQKFGSLWWENWANPGSTGTSYIDQIIVKTVGPIGFKGGASGGGDITPPVAPVNLRIQ